MIVAVKLEFRELLAGEWYLAAIGPDGGQIEAWQHPRNATGQEAIRYYRTICGHGHLQAVTPTMIADELHAFRPGLFLD